MRLLGYRHLRYLYWLGVLLVQLRLSDQDHREAVQLEPGK